MISDLPVATVLIVIKTPEGTKETDWDKERRQVRRGKTGEGGKEKERKKRKGKRREREENAKKKEGKD